MTSLYSLRSTPKEGEYIVTKFDLDYNVDSLYALNATECMCPAGHKPKCRHRTMLPLFLAHHHIDDGWFLDWDTRLWRKPLGDGISNPAGAALNALDATLADPLMLPATDAPGHTDLMISPEAIDIATEGVEINDITPMMDTIRTLAAADEESIFTCIKCEANYTTPEPVPECPVCGYKPLTPITNAVQEEPSPASPPAATPAPAPEVTRSVGAGAPLKRRRITL